MQVMATPETVKGRFASFVIDLEGFPAVARPAMRSALKRIGAIVLTPIPIVVEASWEPLDGGLIGSGGGTVRLLSGGIAGEGTWFAEVLANDILEEDRNPDLHEISIRLDSETDWYFGTDGKGPASQADLIHTVMHELVHGLGMHTELEVFEDQGRWGSRTPFTRTDPMRFDVFVENGPGQSLMTDFVNPSVELGEQITGEDLFFGGPTATTGNGGTRPALYAPDPYRGSASVAHVDRIFDGTREDLMTPSAGFPSQSLGPATRGILADLAYYIAHARTVSLNLNRHLVLSGRVLAPLGYPPCRSNIVVVIERFKDRRWVKIATDRTNAKGAFSTRVSDEATRYRARILRLFKGPLRVNACLPDSSPIRRHRH
jgi:hypothetical protein